MFYWLLVVGLACVAFLLYVRASTLADALLHMKRSLEEKTTDLAKKEDDYKELLRQRSKWENDREQFQHLVIPVGFVNDRLMELALRFKTACDEQERLRGSVADDWSLVDADRKVAFAKEEFNKARDLARAMFYRVSDHLEDYLK